MGIYGTPEQGDDKKKLYKKKKLMKLTGSTSDRRNKSGRM